MFYWISIYILFFLSSRSSSFIFEIDPLLIMCVFFSRQLVSLVCSAFEEHTIYFNIAGCANFFQVSTFGVLFNLSLPSSCKNVVLCFLLEAFKMLPRCASLIFSITPKTPVKNSLLKTVIRAKEMIQRVKTPVLQVL